MLCQDRKDLGVDEQEGRAAALGLAPLAAEEALERLGLLLDLGNVRMKLAAREDGPGLEPEGSI